MRSGINAREKSRRDCASLLKEERDDRENRVEDERRDLQRDHKKSSNCTATNKTQSGILFRGVLTANATP
jgi:hypothetical protein